MCYVFVIIIIFCFDNRVYSIFIGQCHVQVHSRDLRSINVLAYWSRLVCDIGPDYVSKQAGGGGFGFSAKRHLVAEFALIWCRCSCLGRESERSF